ncbi:MAG: undecaprenyldiphospho-muramoylpentapeptide beta-N-acetylglucosaminyltransferase [Armatimonadetes bacterium]|nr:undecaprenyldiphospho-muramoylpentapeptide beta-N-acetylglucosaminyltransferase [Armatimonadota bacterium]
MKVALTGGGTGGHIYPAISVGQAALEADPGVDLLFIGSSHGPEGKLASDAGIPFKAVPSAPLTKSLSIASAAAMIKLIAGIFRARRILKNFGPDVVIGTGGYTTAAVLLAARSLGCKIVIHEQNAVPGRTNLWLTRISDKVCVSVGSSAKFFSADKVVVTGMPVRKDFAALIAKADARRELGLSEDLFTILVVGGSQGAKRLNELVIEMWPKLDDGATQIFHQVGERNISDMQAHAGLNYRVEAYVDMPLAVAAADMVICRSGASTIAEITAAGLPSILVPYPYAYADHQKLNAQDLVSKNAAIMCEESMTTPEMLAEIVSDLRANPKKLDEMASASKKYAITDASQKVAEVAMNLIADS